MKTEIPSVSLPAPIAAYWVAANAGHVDEAAAWFAPHAVVHDEHQQHATPEAIRAWIAGSTRKYSPIVVPLRVAQEKNAHHITARVSGNFSGSPLELDYLFVVENGKISSLTVD